MTSASCGLWPSHCLRIGSRKKSLTCRQQKRISRLCLRAALEEGNNEKDEKEPIVVSGSPLPGVKSSAESMRIPKADLDIIRDQVFTFDTFFPTDQEIYEGGVTFRGNLRGEAENSYKKLNSRLQEKFGNEYKLFIVSDIKENKPISIVVRNAELEEEASSVPEAFAVAAFGLVTTATILLRNSPALQINFLKGFENPSLLLDALPGAMVTIGVLLAHEAGHYFAAQRVGAQLSLPYLIPSWQLGCFGGITRIKNILRDRKDLLEVAIAGPLAGYVVSLMVVIVGLAIHPAQGEGVMVSSSIFHDSFLVGALAKAVLGDELIEGQTLAINPLVLAAWGGLLINAINCIPVGELDGGRIAQAVWGRKGWTISTGLSLGMLGIGGLFSDVSLYWVVLIVFLQRGPIPPQHQEITAPPFATHTLPAILILFITLFVCFPFPFSLSLPTM